MPLRRPHAVLVGLLLVACCAGWLWLESFAPHTDDGCPAETHCLACRTSFVRSSWAPASLHVLPALVVLHQVSVPPPRFVAELVTSDRASRGPPLFS